MLHEQDTFCTVQALSMMLRVLGVVGMPLRSHRFRPDEGVKCIVVQGFHQHLRNFFPGAGVLVGCLPKARGNCFLGLYSYAVNNPQMSFTCTSLIYVFITCCLGMEMPPVLY